MLPLLHPLVYFVPYLGREVNKLYAHPGLKKGFRVVFPLPYDTAPATDLHPLKRQFKGDIALLAYFPGVYGGYEHAGPAQVLCVPEEDVVPLPAYLEDKEVLP